MGTKDPRVDAYIANAEEFARPILERLRAIVHQAAPEIEETMKWSFPHFVDNGIVCSMAAFKSHCAFGFWKGSLLLAGDQAKTKEAMGQFGRITSIDDLPPKKILVGLVREAVRLNREGVKVPKKKPPRRRREPAVPPELAAALERNPAAKVAFERFSPSHRREYVEWIAEAKRDETRSRRIATALGWIAEGKSRNWKYERRGQR